MSDKTEEMFNRIRREHPFMPEEYVRALAEGPDTPETHLLARVINVVAVDLERHREGQDAVTNTLRVLDRELDEFQDVVSRRLRVLEETAGISTIVETLIGKGN